MADRAAPRAATAPLTAYVDRLLAGATLPRVLARAAECALLAEMDLPRPILDVGAGDGTFAAALFDAPVDAGIDPWLHGLRQARRLGAYVHLAQAAGDRLPFRDGSFATVLSNSTLEHTADPAAILAEMHRVTAPGGTCVVTVPGSRFPEYLLGSTVLRALRLRPAARAYGAFMNRVSRHRHVHPPEVWLAWLEGAGFRVERWRAYFGHRQTMALDLSHYLSLPSLVTRAVLGRWVLWPGKRRYLPLARLLAPLAAPGHNGDGAYLLFHCRKP